MAVVHYAMNADDLRIEVFEDVADEIPVVLLTLNARTVEGDHVFGAFILELNLATLTALCHGVANVAAVVSATHGPKPS